MNPENPQSLPVEVQDNARHFSEGGFWRKLRRHANRIGRVPVETALTLYFTLRDERTPNWCRGVILGTLGYFISLIDAIPDLTPVLGYTDDLGVMLAAVAALGLHVSPESREKARETTNRFFDPDKPSG